MGRKLHFGLLHHSEIFNLQKIKQGSPPSPKPLKKNQKMDKKGYPVSWNLSIGHGHINLYVPPGGLSDGQGAAPLGTPLLLRKIGLDPLDLFILMQLVLVSME
jgi:hypothetical protein